MTGDCTSSLTSVAQQRVSRAQWGCDEVPVQLACNDVATSFPGISSYLGPMDLLAQPRKEISYN